MGGGAITRKKAGFKWNAIILKGGAGLGMGLGGGPRWPQGVMEWQPPPPHLHPQHDFHGNLGDCHGIFNNSLYLDGELIPHAKYELNRI